VPSCCRAGTCDAPSNLWTPVIAATKLPVTGAPRPVLFCRISTVNRTGLRFGVSSSLLRHCFCFGRLSSSELIVVSRPVVFAVIVFFWLACHQAYCILCRRPSVLRSATRVVHPFRFSRIVRPRRRFHRANPLKHIQPFWSLLPRSTPFQRTPTRDGSRRRVRDRYGHSSTRRPVVLCFPRSLYSSDLTYTRTHRHGPVFVVINIRAVVAVPFSAPDGYHRPVITSSTSISPGIRSYTR